MNWKYTDATKSSVFRVTSAGTESCLVDAISDWISEGNTPDPADLPDQFEAVEAKKVAIRGVCEAYLNRLGGIAFAAQLAGNTATTAAYLLVRQGLLDMTKDLPTDPELVDAEVVKRYGALLLLCTPEMMTAFAKVDA